uniref:Tf2-1-like SH3-like domain-containing protein n=1 Tax=Ananas comosus var. bracteatus TaxID=296719 RepID=A0A6V7NJ11_ANACO|nr:unnamed protein product [Ananas comosus var. bracteatus]
MIWDEFRGSIFPVYFPDAEKEKFQERFPKLRQVDRTMRRYEREFFRVSCTSPRIDFSTAFHPQSDGQSERTIQILEDMLRACVLDYRGGWHEYLPMAEFAYNNMGERVALGPDVVREAEEKVRIAREKLVTAQSRQRSYANKRRKDLEFAVGDRVFLKVSPMKGVKRFGLRGKLSPRYVGPYEVLERIGPVAYRLALPPKLAGVHNVFHVSNLRKYFRNSSHVLEYEPVELHEDVTYEEFPVSILAREERKLRNRTIPYVKTYEDVLDRALWVERGNAIAREERDSFEKDKEKSKKHSAGGSAGQSSSKRPPRYPRSHWRGARRQSRTQSTSAQCVICCGDHWAICCPQREGGVSAAAKRGT